MVVRRGSFIYRSVLEDTINVRVTRDGITIILRRAIIIRDAFTRNGTENCSAAAGR